MELEVEFEPEELPEIEIEEEAEQLPEFGENLADYLDESFLSSLVSDIETKIQDCEETRKPWYDAYKDGLKLLGLEIEKRNEPWEGACGAFSSLLSEAVVRFQAHAITELFPASGPARTVIYGQETPDRLAAAERVQSELNYLTTLGMPEYRSETEHLLFRVPLMGSCFRCVDYDPVTKMPRSLMVPAEQMLVAPGATHLLTAPYFIRKMENLSWKDIEALQLAGFYRDIDLIESPPEITEVQEAIDKIEKVESRSVPDSDEFTLYETYIYLNLPGPFGTEALAPYIVTHDRGSGRVLSVYRGWSEEDTAFRRLPNWVHYSYLPGLGFYGIGLIHLIGGLADTATSLLRQLVDAGTISNLPGGFKTRGFRVKNEDEPFRPGTWRTVDVGSGTLRDGLYPLPTKEPSATLLALLKDIIEEGRRLGSVVDFDSSAMSSEAPVGTILAILERNLKLMSAVHQRLHAALGEELRAIGRVVADNMDETYLHAEVDANRIEDFSQPIGIIPVSDPNASTMAQRMLQAQAVGQLVAAHPEQFDIAYYVRWNLETIDVKQIDDLLVKMDEPRYMDPVSENMAVMNRMPIKAFPSQNHEAHIAVHMASIQDPKTQELLAQSPAAPTILAAMQAHVAEHLAFEYRKQIEKKMGVPLPPPDEPLPEDVEYNLSSAMAEAADALLKQHQAEAQAAEQEAAMNDPQIMVKMRELDIREKELDIREKNDKEMRRIDQERIDSNERIQGAILGAKYTADEKEAERTDVKDGIEIGMNIGKSLNGTEEKVAPEK